MNQVELDAKEVKDVLNYIIKNNQTIQAAGKTPVATEIIGESGLGKTSILLQLAKEQGIDLVKLNLAQIEEIGDLVGFPARQFQLIAPPKTKPELVVVNGQRVMKNVIIPGTGGELEWVDEIAVTQYTSQNYKFTGKKRMSYCPPEWIADKVSGGILILDDWNRAD